MVNYFKLNFLFLIFLGFSIPTFANEIKGVVGDKSGEPLAGANILVIGTQTGGAAGPDGRYVISNLADGIYTIEVSMIGYERKRVEVIVVKGTSSIEVNFELAEEAVPLNEIIVTPGHFSMMAKQPTTTQSLKREDLRSFPQLGEDVYRAVTRLPGLTGSDFSSKFAVRGGEQEEVLVLLDGMKLYDPFHLKDFTGVVSVIDVEAIGSIDLITGAFPAQYGDRLSGVFNIKTANPSFGKRRTSVALSFMNARFLSEGGFAGGKGQWLFLARRGYIDVILKLTGEDDNLSPFYYDILSKVQYHLNKKHSLSFNVLRSDDDLEFIEDEDTVTTSYGSSYGWLTWWASFHPKLLAQTVLSIGKLDQSRKGFDLTNRSLEILAEVDVRRDFNFLGVKQDWNYDLSERLIFKWGADYKHVSAIYDYFNQDRIGIEVVDGNRVLVFDTTQIDLEPSGNELGLYLSTRMRLFQPLTTEIGLRYDRASWTDDKKISPRFNLAYALTSQTSLRFGWGKFYQSQGIHELQVQDDDQEFYPATLAEHRVIGFEQRFNSGVNLRVEAYEKEISGRRPRYQNLSNQLEAFPEVEEDRIRLQPESGKSKGIEFFMKKDTGNKFNWWGSYSFAIVEDKINGVNVPRNFDQRHTVYLDLSYKPNPKWRLNLSWQYHSGWPFTESTVEKVDFPDGSIDFVRIYGAVNGERLSAYHRMDVRINRYFDFAKSKLSFFFEVRNLYNRDNARLFENNIIFDSSTNTFRVEKVEESWLPLLPSLGFSFDF